MNRLRDWWRARNDREQRMLIVMAVAIGAFIYWIGLWRPLDHARDRMKARYAGAAQAHLETRRGLALLSTTRGVTPPAGEAYLQAIRATAGGHGVDPGRETEGTRGGPAFEIERVAPAAFFAWLDALQSEHGIAPDSLHVELRDGLLQARVEFPPAP